MKLHKEIKAMRLCAELTQKQLAQKVGTQQTVIVRMESPKNEHSATLALLERIARACGRDVELIFPVKEMNGNGLMRGDDK